MATQDSISARSRGTLYLRGSIWWISVCKKGKRTRQSLGVRNRPEAERRRDAFAGPTVATIAPVPDVDITKRWAAMASRARKGGWPFTITKQQLALLFEMSGGRCAVTGLPFSRDRKDGWKKAPFAPTVDRIDRDRGYTFANCRIVCHVANVAMNEWGEEVFLEAALAASRLPGRQMPE